MEPDMHRRDTIKTKSYRLTRTDAVNVWIRYWHGEFQHHIAGSYMVNPGRVSDVLKERIHSGSKAEAAQKLTPQV
jgi:hypothetical protein